jgi:acyl-CoA thioester hydrolase
LLSSEANVCIKKFTKKLNHSRFYGFFYPTSWRVKSLANPHSIREVAQYQGVMYQNKTSVRVRYAETDQMGIVYYGVYPQYFEVGRVEALRELGMTYREMEENGTMLPVKHLEINYHSSARYDDLLTIHTFIKEIPGVRITFVHEVYNEQKQLLTSGKVVLVFVSSKTMKPKKAPSDFLDKMKPFF